MLNQLKRVSMRTAFNYLEKDPEKNILKLMNWVDKLAGNGKETFEVQRKAVREALEDPNNNMNLLTMKILKETDPEVLKKVFENFFLNANILGGPRQEECRRKYDCNIPWAILLDPTSACNLHCTGCWAAEYGNKLNLTFDEIDSIITQGKDLGVYLYIYTGGEPLVRKDDIIKICEKHNDCQFLSFTNGTLIDEDFANEMLRVKNFIPSISIEGFEDATDGRRGEGTYQKVMDAIAILNEKRLPYGLSCCYTSQNLDSISSYEFFEKMVELNARFAWFFHYMPVGNDAVPDLMPSPEQRKFMYDRVREIRRKLPIFVMDFQNDAEFVGGCIAGGRTYLHINANGDVDPCVFIHYSNANIRDMSLLDALRSPIFMAYHKNQPFNNNHLRPCPMLENPEKLREMVKATGAHSTDLQSPESVDHLCDKCEAYAKNWKPTADSMWELRCKEKEEEKKLRQAQ